MSSVKMIKLEDGDYVPEELQQNQQRKIYPDESEGLLRIQTQDRCCTV